MIVVGVGASRGCPEAELRALVDEALAEAELKPGRVDALATADIKADEPAVLALAAHHGWPLRTHPADALAQVDVPTPSTVVARHVGTPSVAEASALLTSGGALLVEKRRSAHATCAVAGKQRPRGARSRGTSPQGGESRSAS